METTIEMLDGVEEELLARSFLFTDPVSYRDGVGATTDAVRVLLARFRLVAMNAKASGEESS